MNLVNGEIGEKYTVDTIDLEANLKRRLQMLGLTKGTSIEILNHKNGSVIFKFRGTRFAAGKEIASGIKLEGETI